MRRPLSQFIGVAGLLLIAVPAAAQSFPTEDPVIKAIWAEGMDRSQAYDLAQALLDSIGPRLTGSPGHKAANDWAVSKLTQWGITARNEQYGTWQGWRRGVAHADLIAPRVRSLAATMLAWSPGTGGGVVEAPVVALPKLAGADEFDAWLPSVNGKVVLASFYQPTCRPDESWQQYATEESFRATRDAREAAQSEWNEWTRSLGNLDQRLEQAGAVGLLKSNWSGGWGASRVFAASTERVATFDVRCEDYGLLYRLAERNQGPVVRLEADAEFLGDGPVYNTVAEIRGSELPNEYVLLSAHYDSWDGASGATDNGTGSVTMLEAIRILKQVYPNPKRTILLGLWGGEEQGLIGSRAYAESHPEIVEQLQALLNQDNGTGRVANISMQGLTEAGSNFGRWLARVPQEITQHIDLGIPGTPSGGGTDNASFVCYGAPAFSLFATNFHYFEYTWHTNLDTFDKLVFDDLKNNATLTAMLAYLASEDSEHVSRERRVMPVNARTGEQREWPACQAARTWDAYRNR